MGSKNKYEVSGEVLEYIIQRLECKKKKIDEHLSEGDLRHAKWAYIQYMHAVNLFSEMLPMDLLIEHATYSQGYRLQIYEPIENGGKQNE